jgi:hypothetical protein
VEFALSWSRGFAEVTRKQSLSGPSGSLRVTAPTFPVAPYIMKNRCSIAWHVCIMSAIARCVSWGPIHPRHMTRLHLSTYLSRYPRVPKPREGRGKRFPACAQYPRRTRGTESAILDAFPGILVVRRLPFYPGPSPHPERRPQTIYPTTSFLSERLINAKQCQLFSAQKVFQTSCHIQATL